MPVALETQAMRGGPPASSLSPEGIAHRRMHIFEHSQPHLYTNATLMREQWLDIDNLWIRVAGEWMGAVMDLQARGLTRSITSLGDAASAYRTVGRMEPAGSDMRASAAGNDQRLTVGEQQIPLPFAFEDYDFDITEFEALQNNGAQLDLAYAEEAQRSVAEKFESWLINGAPDLSSTGSAIYGYRTHPSRVAKTGSSWATIDGIYNTILGMHSDMLNLNRPGPYGLYMNVAEYGKMFAKEGVDVFSNGLARINQSFPQIVSIKPTFAMPAGQAVLVELQRRTVDLAVKMDPTSVPWEVMGGLRLHVRFIGSIVPRVKADGANKTGVVHYSGLA